MFESGEQTNISIEELEALFNEDSDQETPTGTEEKEMPDNTGDTPPAPEQPEQKDVTTTKAFSDRLKEKTTKAVEKERAEIAKNMGFESYEAMIKSREEKLMSEKGLDPEQVRPVVEELLKQRLENDPRMKELDALRKKQLVEFGKAELAEISKLTNGEVTKFEQLPKEVVEIWKQKGSLKSAYLEVKGEELIMKARSGQSKGTTDHLASPTGNTPSPKNQRLLTEQEKEMYKYFNPRLSDEELNKKTVDK